MGFSPSAQRRSPGRVTVPVRDHAIGRGGTAEFVVNLTDEINLESPLWGWRAGKVPTSRRTPKTILPGQTGRVLECGSLLPLGRSR